MARTVASIITTLDNEQAAQTSLSGLNSTSQTSIFKLWKYITAVCQNIIEQLWDEKKTELEEIVASAPVGSDYWLQKKVLEFQYNSLVPQVLELNTTTLAIAYNPINTSYRIISRAAVITTGARKVSVKVATGEPPAALSAPQLSALNTYLTNGGDGTYNGRGVGLGFAGTQITAVSYAPDKFYLKAEIKYDGQYAGVISSTVIAAIKDYYANIDFNGKIKIITLFDYIQAVPGVVDIIIEDAAIRADSVLFANKAYLIQSFTEILSDYQTYSGYVVEETTVGEDLASRLTFTATT